MIDTCQANTMYSKIYSPNIIATGSSELDQSSYSHHADNDVGVAVIDRYTYYNLDFLETQVREPSSKMTLGHLFDSYDEAKIHSHPGVRYDLFPGGEKAARERLVMDFFGNAQNVEIEPEQTDVESQWKTDLEELGKMIAATRATLNHSDPKAHVSGSRSTGANISTIKNSKHDGAAKVNADYGWRKQAVGALTLLGCIGVWVAGSWMESKT